jgi:hypothetical protein
MRRAAKVDSNQDAVVDAYRGLGCTVTSLAGLGRGVPDLLVGYRGKLSLVEVKTPKGKLRPMQEEFRKLWPVRVVRSVEDVMQHVEAMR